MVTITHTENVPEIMQDGNIWSAYSPVDDPSERTCILIVTPTYNSEQFLDDTILSVVSQSGNFWLRYHIQDGGSSDATMHIVKRWERLLRSGDFPILCAGITFSCDSRSDAGMYQAINRGIAHARPGRPFLTGWINSDDRLAPGALAAVDGIYRQFPDVSFTCARVSMIDQHGVITGVNLPIVYDRQRLSDGLHDGRLHSFVMQEGTFWRSALWDQVGGLDEGFRLAGDWDLWRRFARYAALFTVDSVLGFHRRHERQLSADLERYYAEIDAANHRSSVANSPVSGGVSETLKFNLDSKRWERTKRYGASLGTPIVHYEGMGAGITRRVEFTSGARRPEGPYPEAHLPGGMRWIDDVNAVAAVTVPYPGLWRMHLRIRNWRPDLRLLVRRGLAVCLDVLPGAGDDGKDTLLFASLWLEGGRNEIRVESEGRFDETEGWLFVLLEWYVVAPVASDPVYLASRHTDGKPIEGATNWPAISIVVSCSNAGRRLDLTLDAILGQGYPEVDICVVDDGSSDVNRQILMEYAPYIDHVVTSQGAHRHTAVSRAIDLSSGILVAVLDDTVTLAPGALFALGDACRRVERVDLVVGITVDELRSTPITRRLPGLVDGCLSLRDLLRIGLGAECSTVFDRGALFFTRRIWQQSGGHLIAATPDCAALDFWVRCAKVGATLRTLAVDLTYRAIDGNHREVRRNPDTEDVRSHAELLVEQNGLVFGRETSVTARSKLKILMLDAAGIGDRPSDGCRRLATALAAAHQRVVCLVDDEDTPDGEGQPNRAASALEAIRIERPDLIVVFGDILSTSSDEIINGLDAERIPTVVVRERRAPVQGLGALQGFDHMPEDRRPPRADGSLPVVLAVAKPYGVLAYGDPDVHTERRDATGEHRRTLHGLRAGVDMSVYKPNLRAQARRVLGLPAEAFIVLVITDQSTAPSPSLAVTIEAYGRLDCDAKLLLILGYTGELPSIGAPIARADDLGADDLNALFNAAADAVVSGLGNQVEMPLVQAAAAGTPTIVAGGGRGGKTIREATLGLQLSAWTTPLLAEGLRRLHADKELHRRLSRSALAYTRANHSLEACAWSFMTLIGRLHGFHRLHLPSELEFPVLSLPIALRSLQSERARPLFSVSSGDAGSSPSLRDSAAGCTLLSGEQASLYVRAPHGGPQRLRVRAVSRAETLLVSVRVNGEDCATLEFVTHGDGLEPHFVHAHFFRGLNRIDLSLVSSSGSSAPSLVLQSFDFKEEFVIDADKVSHPWQPLIGFADADHIDANGAPSRWIDGPSATLRLWSDVAGPRHLRLFVVNYVEQRSVEVAINGVVTGSIDIPTTEFLASTKIVQEVMIEAGWNLISLTTYLPPQAPGFGCDFLMLVTNAYFTALDDRLSIDDESSDIPEFC